MRAKSGLPCPLRGSLDRYKRVNIDILMKKRERIPLAIRIEVAAILVTNTIVARVSVSTLGAFGTLRLTPTARADVRSKCSSHLSPHSEI